VRGRTMIRLTEPRQAPMLGIGESERVPSDLEKRGGDGRMRRWESDGVAMRGMRYGITLHGGRNIGRRYSRRREQEKK